MFYFPLHHIRRNFMFAARIHKRRKLFCFNPQRSRISELFSVDFEHAKESAFSLSQCT